MKRGAIIVMALFAGACSGDDGGGPDSPYPTVDPTSTTASTTPTDGAASTDDASTTTLEPEPADTTTTSTAPPVGAIVLTAHDIESDDGTTGRYELTLAEDVGLLCFEAAVDNDDPEIALALGTVSECIGEEGPLAGFDTAMSVSVGALDGDKRYGYVWGRVRTGIEDVRMTFDDATSVAIPVAEVSGFGAFALVIDTLAAGRAETLEARDSGGSVVATETIGDFLRSGPTYPTVEPTDTTAPPTTYPTTGG